jgi:hypothetical protein
MYSYLVSTKMEPKHLSSSINQWLKVLEDYLLSINTDKQVLKLHLPYLIVVGSSKFVMPSVLIKVLVSITRRVDLGLAEVEAEADIFDRIG